MKRAVAFFMVLAMLISSVPALAKKSGDWKYTAADGEITLTRYLSGEKEAASVTVPKKIDGAKVTGVCKGTFEDCPSITEIVFPRKNVELEEGALTGCGENMTVKCRDGGTVRAFCEKYGYEWAIIAENAADEPTPAPSDEAFPIDIDITDIKLGVGQKWLIPARAVGEISYVSSNEKVAKVDESGVVTARKKGKATITLSTPGGQTAEVNVKVIPAPTKITAKCDKAILGAGETAAIVCELNSGAAEITFVSKDESVITVSDTGIVTAVAPGSANIIAKTHNGKKAKLRFEVREAPAFIELSEIPALGVGQKHAIAAIMPEGAHSNLTYTTSDAGVAKISKKGAITAVAPGTAVIRVETHLPEVFAEAEITVTEAPNYVSLDMKKLVLGVGEKYQLLPDTEGRAALITYATSNKSIAKVSKTGLITAKAKGSASITLKTHNGKTFKLKVAVKSAPAKLRFNVTEATLSEGETFQLTWSLPESGNPAVIFTSSDETIATADENGLITAVGRGECDITGETYNGVTATCHVLVFGADYPIKLSIEDTKAYVDEGATYVPVIKVSPEGADARAKWTSSDKSIARVDENGAVTGVSFGRATITGTSIINPNLSVKYTILVLTEKYCLTIPEQRTNLDGLSANLGRIGKIKESAVMEIERLYATEEIDSSEYSRRKVIMNRAFSMYAFPFMVSRTQKYWSLSNSNNGKKDFQPGTVYYGLPYNSGSVSNRTYDAEKAVSRGYYKKTSGGYYIMNQDKPLNGSYAGNDCSSFVSLAIWGSGAHSLMRTSEIAVSDVYYTVNDDTAMRPGDIMCLGGRHVIMFLYYANAARTQMVILEQGGRGEYTNTVWCSIVNVSTYSGGGYKIRRLVSF